MPPNDPIHFLAGAVRTLQKQVTVLETQLRSLVSADLYVHHEQVPDHSKLVPKRKISLDQLLPHLEQTQHRSVSTDAWTSPVDLLGSWVPLESQTVNGNEDYVQQIDDGNVPCLGIKETLSTNNNNDDEQNAVSSAKSPAVNPVELTLVEDVPRCLVPGVSPVDSASDADNDSTALNLSEGHAGVPVESLPGFGWSSPSSGIPRKRVQIVHEGFESEVDEDTLPFWCFLDDRMKDGLDELADIGCLATCELLEEVVTVVGDKLTREHFLDFSRKTLVNAVALMMTRIWTPERSSKLATLMCNSYGDIVELISEATYETLMATMEARSECTS